MKIASRYLLPAEFITAVILFSWGLSGWMGGASLYQMLKAHDLNDEWGILFCGVGLAQFLVAMAELFFGQRWSQKVLFISVTARFWLAFFAMSEWLYACYAVLWMQETLSFFSLVIQAPAALICTAWIAYGNRKVSIIMDPSISTKKLQSEMMRRRRGWNAEEN